MNETRHISVLLNESIEYLQASKGGQFLDCTLGGAGHTKAILDSNSKNTVDAIDRDIRAIDRAKIKLSEYLSRVNFHHLEFASITEVIEEKKYDGMLIDLGISTDQIKENRGFSFHDESPLDMRMNEEDELTADFVVNNYPEKELIKVLKKGGADKEGYPAAKAIISNRPIKTAKQLADIVSKAVSFKSNKGKSTHPATTVFQAIRIEVNKEYEQIEKILDLAPMVVKVGGRLVVITFHSDEDKLVASRMRNWAAGDTTPAKLRFLSFDKGSKGRFLTTKPVVASEAELSVNPAARSARLRVFEFA
jgi:16S rRNA (cytosine1402-N4)-methyltransferase